MRFKVKRISYFAIILAVFSIQPIVYASSTDPWLDQVISWIDVAPFTSDDPIIVLGPPTGSNGHTISTDDELIVAFTNNFAFDGDGDDIFLYENVDASDPETVDVWASIDNIKYVYLGNALNDEGYDLSDYDELESIRYLKFIGTSIGGSSPGYDLLAVEAINSVPITDKDLLYTPVTPCRIVDTRKSEGAISANDVRSYNVRGSVASQGGNPAGCPSPKGEPHAVHVNVTSVPLGNGWITAYPFGSSAPTASLVNYRSDAQNVANSGTIKTCFNCGKDISIKSGGGTTHVIIDVLGYYYEP